MNSTMARPMTLLCLASEFKAVPFLLEAHRLGCRIILLVSEKAAGEAWPWESIDQVHRMPVLWKQPDITYGVSYLARTNQIDRIVALDDYDVETAADLREHLRLAGIGHSQARYFRDKLAMRLQAREAGLPVPAFTSLFNFDALRTFLATVPPPWVLKPRFEAGSIGIRKLDQAQAVWQVLEELGDKQSFYLLEAFVPGQVYHVDSVLWQGQAVFSHASRYGLPPLAVSHEGGVFSSRTLPASWPEAQAVLGLNRQLMAAFGLQNGVSHSEFIQGEDGAFYFLETAARVGGANLDRLVEAATGVSLWQEAARVEVAHFRGQPYQPPVPRERHAGILTCLARQEWPDLASFEAPEVVWRLPKAYHAGLILASDDRERLDSLMADYATRFAQEFVAVGRLKEIRRQ